MNKMNNKLTVRIKNVYGQDLIYPACNITQAITRISGKKTLSNYDVEVLKGVGFEFEVKAQEL